MSAIWMGAGIYLLLGLVMLICMHAYVRLTKKLVSDENKTSWKEQVAIYLALLAAWPLVLGVVLHEDLFSRPHITPVYRDWVATPDSLIEHLSRENIEQQERYSDPFSAVPDLPFGHLHEAWQCFCQQRQDEDQLWSFRIDVGKDEGLDYCKRYGIVEGYALLRDGEICGEFFARMD